MDVIPQRNNKVKKRIQLTFVFEMNHYNQQN